LFEIRILQIDRAGNREKTFDVDRFGLWINRHPHNADIKDLAGTIKDIQLVIVEDDIALRYPFVTIWIKSKET